MRGRAAALSRGFGRALADGRGRQVALSNTEIRYYDSNVLRLPADKRKDYHAQVDRLISELCKHVRDRSEIKITKVVKAGSFAKYTILRKTTTDPVDVDVVFYISGRDIGHETLASINDLIYSLLIKIYPTKSVEDFEIQRKAATVTFVGSGLSVDIVPVIEDAERPGYGWQFDIHDGSAVQTCAPCQIKFVRDRKNTDGDFRTLVRLAKKWRNHAEVKPLKSFLIELIMAHILEKQGTGGTVEQRFRNFLLYIAQSGLKDEISFPENTAPFVTFTDPVVILDPVYSPNNVASRISESERLEIVAAATAAWETATYASAENDNAVWKELFGPRFKTED
jgi:tRNA nucleotidyltransferase (CCA-adding enzyme)